MFIDLKAGNVAWSDVYKLFIGFITPRPIALVSSLSSNGIPNLAPFSWYNMVSANPPVVVVSTSVTRDKSAKDTLRNIEATREFAIATVTEAIAEPMTRCAASLPPEESEFEYSGLTAVPAKLIKPALVKESPINIECKLRDIIKFGDHVGAGNMIMGDIVALHVEEWVLAADGIIDSRKLRTLGRLGRDDYVTVMDPYEMKIPQVTRGAASGHRA